MIDRINGNGGYDFPGNQKRKNSAVRAYENTPGSKEAALNKAAGIRKKGSAGPPDQDESGVILDLSGKSARKKKEAYAAGEKKEASWTTALRRIFMPVVKWLKDFWESDSTLEEQVSEQEQSEILLNESTEAAEPEMLTAADELPPMDETEAAGGIKAIADQAVKSGDLHQIEQFVTQNGRKRLAHNSDLLTYYDRSGKFVEMDETEKYRVLFGDKNVLKL